MTKMANDLVSAPGKLFLMGEYAVLAGAPAVVTAIDRRVSGRFVPGAAPSSPLVAEVLRTIADRVRVELPAGAPQIDSSTLMVGERKLGLGSSAAVAAAAVGATLAALESDLQQSKSYVFDLAFRAHRAAQGGRGSGADVAAAVHGGVIHFSRDPEGQVSIRPLPALPAELVVFSTGSPSPTVDHLRAVERLESRDRATYLARISELKVAADKFVRSYEGGNVRRLIAATDAAGEALEALGRDADFPIVIPALGFAAKLARELGGAAKPSGAGGGDVGIALFGDAEAADAFRNRVPPLGVEILSIRTTDRGLERGP